VNKSLAWLLGSYNPDSTEAFFKQQKLPTFKSHGFTMFAFGSGSGPNDLFFLFIDSNTAAFGHRTELEKMLSVRYGGEEGLMRNDNLFPLINETNGTGVVWAVLKSCVHAPGDAGNLRPQVQQFPEAVKLVTRMQNLMINVQASSGIDGKFQAVCGSSDDAKHARAVTATGFSSISNIRRSSRIRIWLSFWGKHRLPPAEIE